MYITGFGISDTGAREQNEDAYYVDNKLGLYIVCDGMGGHAAGQVAAEMSIENIKTFFAEHRHEVNEILKGSHTSEKSISLVIDAIHDTCAKVHKKACSVEAFGGMGTTLSLLWIHGNSATLGHVGDSRIYLLRHNKMHQLTNDHTFVQEMVERGLMFPEQALTSPYAHVLTRSLGTQESVQVDTLHFDVILGDRFLLCSDGLSGVIPNVLELQNFFKESKTEVLVQNLIDAAKELKSKDNITALVIDTEVLEAEQAEHEKRSEDVVLKTDVLRNVYMFKELELQELVRFIDKTVVLELSKGHCLFEEGETDDALYIILQGELEIKQNEQAIAQLSSGNHVGEMAMLSEEPRSASVFAIENSRLLKLEKQDFMSLIHAEPVSGVRLLSAISKELSKRLQVANQR